MTWMLELSDQEIKDLMKMFQQLLTNMLEANEKKSSLSKETQDTEKTN